MDTPSTTVHIYDIVPMRLENVTLYMYAASGASI